MIIIVPDCPQCKTSKDVVFEIADVKNRKTWFHIAYCTKCYTVIECHFQGKLLKRTPRNRSEKEDELKELNKINTK